MDITITLSQGNIEALCNLGDQIEKIKLGLSDEEFAAKVISDVIALETRKYFTNKTLTQARQDAQDQVVNLEQPSVSVADPIV